MSTNRPPTTSFSSNFAIFQRKHAEQAPKNGHQQNATTSASAGTTGFGGNFGIKKPIWQQPQKQTQNQQKKKPTWTDFMEMKRRKLFAQVHDGVVPKTRIFAGVSFHVNGYTNPPAEVLRPLIVQNGGEYHHYWAPPRKGTSTSRWYMVASQLASTKWKSLGKNAPNFVVTPRWIVKCVRVGRRVPVTPYLLIHKSGPVRNDRMRCAGASTLTGVDGRQMSIYAFTSNRRRLRLFDRLYREKMARRRALRENPGGWERQLVDARKWLAERKRRFLLAKYRKKRTILPPDQRPWKFAHGDVEGERHKIFIGNVQFDYTKAPAKEDVLRLAATYKALKSNPNNGRPLEVSMNFLTRLLGGDRIRPEEAEAGVGVHPGWPLVLRMLKAMMVERKEDEGGQGGEMKKGREEEAKEKNGEGRNDEETRREEEEEERKREKMEEENNERQREEGRKDEEATDEAEKKRREEDDGRRMADGNAEKGIIIIDEEERGNAEKPIVID